MCLHSETRSLSRGYLGAPNRQDAPSPVLLCQEGDNLSAFCSALTLRRFPCNTLPQKVRLLDSDSVMTQ